MYALFINLQKKKQIIRTKSHSHTEFVGSGHCVVRFNFRTVDNGPSLQIITDSNDSIKNIKNNTMHTHIVIMYS